MMHSYLFLVFALAAIVYFAAQKFGSEFKTVVSTVDGRKYSVCKTPESPTREIHAANTLARIAAKLERLVSVLASSSEYTDDCKRLAQRFDARAIGEASQESGNGTLSSYTLNKGEKISICLKCRGTCASSGFEPDGVLIFVAIHELAHVANDETGHGAKFIELNRFFLRVAAQHGIWEYKDYESAPVQYCGTTIDAMP